MLILFPIAVTVLTVPSVPPVPPEPPLLGTITLALTSTPSLTLSIPTLVTTETLSVSALVSSENGFKKALQILALS